MIRPLIDCRGGHSWRVATHVTPDFIDEVTEHVQRQTIRNQLQEPTFQASPIDGEHVATLPRVVQTTFNVVADELLQSNTDCLSAKHGKRIHAAVARRIIPNGWVRRLPFRGRLLKFAVRVGVAVALGYLRTQFPILAIADAVKVASILQNVADRKPMATPAS